MHSTDAPAHRPSLLVDLALLTVFFAVGGWSVYTIFLQKAFHVGWARLTEESERVDPARLRTLVRNTPPAAAETAWNAPTLSTRWRHIVVHHSGTLGGNAESFGAYHLNEKRMENGLAYHFVIGNDRGSGDGQVEVGRRWLEQLDGGHVHGEELNRVSIGICLVGDFTRRAPTRAQIASLKGLLNHLLKTTRIPARNVRGHREMQGQSTECPGALPVAEVVRTRREPAD